MDRKASDRIIPIHPLFKLLAYTNQVVRLQWSFGSFHAWQHLENIFKIMVLPFFFNITPMMLCLAVTCPSWLPEAGAACTLKSWREKESFSLNEKRRLLKASDKLPKTSRRDAAEKLGVPQAASCGRLKQRDTVSWWRQETKAHGESTCGWSRPRQADWWCLVTSCSLNSKAVHFITLYSCSKYTNVS